MKWILVLLIAMPCICMVSQDAIPQENAEVDAAIAEINRQEKMAINAVAAKRKSPRGAPLRNPPENVQTLRFLHFRDPTQEFFSVCWKLEGLSDDLERYADYDRMYFRPIIKKLQQYVTARIPVNATESQRNKLNAAALVDIRHAQTDFRASFPKVPERFITEPGDFEIFGPGSLFEKVMRQQGLLDN